MAIPRQMAIYSLVLAAALLLSTVPRLVTMWTARSDIWWTPLSMAVPLPKSQDRVEIYVGDEQLLRLADQGKVLLQTENGPKPIAAGDVRLRFNNWDRVRAERSAGLMGNVFAAGAGGVFLAFGLMGYLDRGRSQA